MKIISLFFICVCYTATPLSVSAQESGSSIFKYDKYGHVKSAEFFNASEEYEYIKSADEFFRKVLKMKNNNRFVRNNSIRLDGRNETFEQFYKGVKIENAGYTFHYDENGNLFYAHGNYVEVLNLDVNPAISKEAAAIAFAKYKALSPDSITNFSAELIIKEVSGESSVKAPRLVYKVSMEVSRVCVSEYGYIDAKTGIVVLIESYINHSAASGTFVTKYYGTKSATTNYNGSNYSLYDPSRGSGIETKDLQNHKIDLWNYYTYAQSIVDNDNYWYYYNFTDSTFMAYDIHWAFQRIYDRLYITHGKNSIDNNGKKIMAYVKALFPTNNGGYTTNNACWMSNRKEFYFGIGSGYNRPFSSLDVVAHEYGHGITSYQIGWSSSEDYLNEGLSDIWGAIMDYRFGGLNTMVWKIGENLPPSKAYIRDIQYPTSYGSVNTMADTYNSSLYQYFDSINDSYGKSGVFSHWFYLLVNGGSGYNSNGQYYNLNPIGMNVAENLIVKAVYDNYLRNTTSYDDVRVAFVAAASSMNVSGLVAAVCNAWYAVGVGNMNLSISGPALTCSESIYSIEGLPSGFNVVWSLSDTYYNSNCLMTDPSLTNQCKIVRSNTQDMINATLTANIIHGSDIIQTKTKSGLYAYAGFKGNYTSGNLSGNINNSYFNIRPNVTTYITSPNFYGATVTYGSSGLTPSIWTFSPTYGDLTMVAPASPPGTTIPVVINVHDSCGNDYVLYAFPSSSYSINVSNGDSGIIVKLIEDGNAPKDFPPDESWTIEIVNATTGRIMATQSSTSHSETISTAGWPKGIYIVKATIGKEELTEKVIVK